MALLTLFLQISNVAHSFHKRPQKVLSNTFYTSVSVCKRGIPFSGKRGEGNVLCGASAVFDAQYISLNRSL